ncbi:MAG: hypothetical protein ACHQJ6_02670 [Candidatus Berkiellales bacterium]
MTMNKGAAPTDISYPGFDPKITVKTYGDFDLKYSPALQTEFNNIGDANIASKKSGDTTQVRSLMSALGKVGRAVLKIYIADKERLKVSPEAQAEKAQVKARKAKLEAREGQLAAREAELAAREDQLAARSAQPGKETAEKKEKDVRVAAEEAKAAAEKAKVAAEEAIAVMAAELADKYQDAVTSSGVKIFENTSRQKIESFFRKAIAFNIENERLVSHGDKRMAILAREKNAIEARKKQLEQMKVARIMDIADANARKAQQPVAKQPSLVDKGIVGTTVATQTQAASLSIIQELDGSASIKARTADELQGEALLHILENLIEMSFSRGPDTVFNIEAPKENVAIKLMAALLKLGYKFELNEKTYPSTTPEQCKTRERIAEKAQKLSKEEMPELDAALLSVKLRKMKLQDENPGSSTQTKGPSSPPPKPSQSRQSPMFAPPLPSYLPARQASQQQPARYLQEPSYSLPPQPSPAAEKPIAFEPPPGLPFLQARQRPLPSMPQPSPAGRPMPRFLPLPGFLPAQDASRQQQPSTSPVQQPAQGTPEGKEQKREKKPSVWFKRD